jgi:hypothetical protein
MIYLHGVAFVNNFVNLPFAFNTTLQKERKNKVATLRKLRGKWENKIK